MADNRRRMLFVKRFFEEYTDEDHAATMYDIKKYLLRCGIEAERKSITEDIYALMDSGMDIFWEEKEKQRRLRSRKFKISEIKMIIDSVASSKTLSEEQSTQLIEKIGELVSVYQRRTLQRRVIVSGRVKNSNDNTLEYLDTINEAIAYRCNIAFQYFQYNMKKEREYKHEGKIYRVHPRCLIYENNIYYLLADDGKEIKTFRVDRMDNVTIDEETNGLIGSGKNIDLDSFSRSTFGMFHGEKEKVRMLFTKEMMDVVIDKFGKDIDVEIVDDEHFRIRVEIAVSPQFYGWVFGLGENVMIEYPLKVAKQMKDMLKERHKAYREEHSRNIYYY